MAHKFEAHTCRMHSPTIGLGDLPRFSAVAASAGVQHRLKSSFSSEKENPVLQEASAGKLDEAAQLV